MTLSDANVPAPLTTLPRERLIDRVVGAIKDYIIANRLQSGDRLPSEQELAQHLGVSRNVVRQALSSLEAVGIVRTEHGRGTFVAEFGAASSILQHLAFWLDIEHLDHRSYFETRLIFDAGVLRLVIERAADEDFDRLEELVQAMEAHPGHHAGLHDTFHLALLEITGNPFLASVGIILYRFMWALAAKAPQVRKVPVEWSAANHRVLLDGLRRRDPALIPHLIAVHLGDVSTDDGAQLGEGWGEP